MTIAVLLDPVRHTNDHFGIVGGFQAHVNENAVDVVLVASVSNAMINQATQGVID